MWLSAMLQRETKPGETPLELGKAVPWLLIILQSSSLSNLEKLLRELYTKKWAFIVSNFGLGALLRGSGVGHRIFRNNTYCLSSFLGRIRRTVRS